MIEMKLRPIQMCVLQYFDINKNIEYILFNDMISYCIIRTHYTLSFIMAFYTTILNFKRSLKKLLLIYIFLLNELDTV